MRDLQRKPEVLWEVLILSICCNTILGFTGVPESGFVMKCEGKVANGNRESCGAFHNVSCVKLNFLVAS